MIFEGLMMYFLMANLLYCHDYQMLQNQLENYLIVVHASFFYENWSTIFMKYVQ